MLNHKVFLISLWALSTLATRTRVSWGRGRMGRLTHSFLHEKFNSK